MNELVRRGFRSSPAAVAGARSRQVWRCPLRAISGGSSARRTSGFAPIPAYRGLTAKRRSGPKQAKRVAARTSLFEHLVGVRTRGSRSVIARRPRREPAPARRRCLASALERRLWTAASFAAAACSPSFGQAAFVAPPRHSCRWSPGSRHSWRRSLLASFGSSRRCANIVLEVVGAWRVPTTTTTTTKIAATTRRCGRAEAAVHIWSR